MLSPKIIEVSYEKDYILSVEFDDGSSKECDLKEFVKRHDLIQNLAFFKSFKIDCGGRALSWNDDIDISEFELYHLGENYG